MHFVKLHGTGNDFVCVDCFRQQLPVEPQRLAPVVCRRHFGVGADGLILILPDASADAAMRIFNADGSEAEMCGNGIRCVARYLVESGRVAGPIVRIRSLRGLHRLEVRRDERGEVIAVRVDMGEPIFEPDRIPAELPGCPPLEVPYSLNGGTVRLSAVSMGNPHCVVFVDEPPETVPLAQLGPALEQAGVFPQRANVEVVMVVDRDRLRLRVWERGAGETLACGTGACAAAVVAALTGRTGRRVVAELPGGSLTLEWSEADNRVYMTGPAERVFEGRLDRSLLEQAQLRS